MSLDDLPATSPADEAALRRLRRPHAVDALRRINDLSAIRAFPSLRQRTRTSAGQVPFRIPEKE